MSEFAEIQEQLAAMKKQSDEFQEQHGTMVKSVEELANIIYDMSAYVYKNKGEASTGGTVINKDETGNMNQVSDEYTHTEEFTDNATIKHEAPKMDPMVPEQPAPVNMGGMAPAPGQSPMPVSMGGMDAHGNPPMPVTMGGDPAMPPVPGEEEMIPPVVEGDPMVDAPVTDEVMPVDPMMDVGMGAEVGMPEEDPMGDVPPVDDSVIDDIVSDEEKMHHYNKGDVSNNEVDNMDDNVIEKTQHDEEDAEKIVRDEMDKSSEGDSSLDTQEAMLKMQLEELEVKKQLLKIQAQKGYNDTAKVRSDEEDAPFDEGPDGDIDGNEPQPAGDMGGDRTDETFNAKFSTMEAQIANLNKTVTTLAKALEEGNLVKTDAPVPGPGDINKGREAGVGENEVITREMQEQFKGQSWRDINAFRTHIGELPSNVF